VYVYDVARRSRGGLAELPASGIEDAALGSRWRGNGPGGSSDSVSSSSEVSAGGSEWMLTTHTPASNTAIPTDTRPRWSDGIKENWLKYTSPFTMEERL
jgi:hypothetical protein